MNVPSAVIVLVQEKQIQTLKKENEQLKIMLRLAYDTIAVMQAKDGLIIRHDEVKDKLEKFFQLEDI